MDEYVMQYVQLVAAVNNTVLAVKEAMETLHACQANLHMLIHELNPEMFYDGEEPDDEVMHDPVFD
jgi:hypothetical protein